MIINHSNLFCAFLNLFIGENIFEQIIMYVFREI